jgi:hypothetical protein
VHVPRELLDADPFFQVLFPQPLCPQQFVRPGRLSFVHTGGKEVLLPETGLVVHEIFALWVEPSAAVKLVVLGRSANFQRQQVFFKKAVIKLLKKVFGHIFARPEVFLQQENRFAGVPDSFNGPPHTV